MGYKGFKKKSELEYRLLQVMIVLVVILIVFFGLSRTLWMMNNSGRAKGDIEVLEPEMYLIEKMIGD